MPNDAPIAAAAAGHRLSVAARDLVTGAAVEYRPGGRYLAASVAKIAIAATLLVRARAERRALTGEERAMAGEMIRVSDNDAAHALWRRTGRDAAMADVLCAFGLWETRTTAESWGLTRTSAADQVRLLAALAGAASAADAAVLDAPRRAYVLRLMAEVAPDQRWGIGAAARPGDRVALKNGWLDYSGDDGRWTVNTVGRLTGGGHDLLVAVLSNDHATLHDGITAVEAAVTATARTLRTAPADGAD